MTSKTMTVYMCSKQTNLVVSVETHIVEGPACVLLDFAIVGMRLHGPQQQIDAPRSANRCLNRNAYRVKQNSN